MNSSPQISIIITCYNQAHFIGNTLKSVLGQTFTHWECIVVDDGSTDDSALVIRSIVKEDARFHYVYQNNAGVSAARNLGFSLAKGQYINFLDGDDTFLPQKLEAQLEVFEKFPEVSICFCDHQFSFENQPGYKYYEFEKMRSKPLEQLLYKWHNGVAFPPHAALYKRGLWDGNEKPFPEDYRHRCEDWVFNVIVALKDKEYYMLDKVLCNYHMSEGNFTADNMNLSADSIHAAIYLNAFIPEKYKSDFIETTIRNSLKMYLESQKSNILFASKNWRIANRLSKPIIRLIRFFDRK